MENAERAIKALEMELRTPKDFDLLNNEDKAGILTLSFIGMMARPKNIPADVLKDCVDAFNNNRGKTEVEEAAVQKVIDRYYPCGSSEKAR